MSEIKIPQYCKDCRSLWKKGTKDGEHNKWCTHWGRPSYRVVEHCKLMHGKTAIGSEAKERD